MKLKRFLHISILLSAFLLVSFDKKTTEEDNDDKFIVVLDAGHGGHDPGNTGNGYLEKNIALGIVLGAGKILEKDPRIKVIYTRKDDTFVDLFKRGEIANKANADLFVSVHCDSHTSNAHGAGTFVLGLHANQQNFEIAKKENSVIYLEDDYETRYADYNINSPESVIGLTIMQEEFLDQSINLAKLMQDNFSQKLKRNDRKVKQAGFIVLHQTFMPSVLVETGFLTNKNEGAYLNSKRGKEEMAAAIADAILSYKKEYVVSVEPPAKKNTLVIIDANKTKPGAKVGASDKGSKTVSKPKVVVKDQSDEEVANASEQVNNDSKKPVGNAAHIVFKVQIFASAKNIPLQSENFKGLNTLSIENYNDLNRYMYGETGDHFQATLLKRNAVAKGYTTSYIVAYKDGKRISESEALKYLSE
ncbi:N-acetylmuramoyl-L-alanine amidase family protein [Arenibacter certesii]|uniref:N-acetylmuramoyl-L-alanine amidase n=1 Tax=Arenibacter certesii TaxID=228955 RepID=A0A918IMG3_9FLAO|nr:N-acetylmuramoyl-L-alanine amidase [Arenibacter certesii]GGW22127.1 N-acetylmuramoyl-L-alanine amidase [Arenibacter certesii]